MIFVVEINKSIGSSIGKSDEVQTDELDEKIINELLANAKTPLREISKKLGTSFVTVMKRIKKLETERVIESYSPKINYYKLGYGIHVIVEIRISKGKLFELERKIAKIPNVFAVYDTTGSFDATVIAKFKTTKAMDAFLKKIQTFDFVVRTNTKLILNTIKEEQMKL